MDDHNRKAYDIFVKASAIDSLAERRAFIDQQCGEDKELCARVEEFFAVEQEAGSFLEKPPFQDGGSRDNATDKEASAEPIDQVSVTESRPAPPPGSSGQKSPEMGDISAGTIIGRYKLLQRIGEGGFGVVWMAEQLEPVERRVALKIIKLGMDTRQVIARFEAERQALAMMDHPNIAKVLDAGATEAGRLEIKSVKPTAIRLRALERILAAEDRIRFPEAREVVREIRKKWKSVIDSDKEKARKNPDVPFVPADLRDDD